VYWFAVRDAQQDEVLPQAKRKPFLMDHFSYFGSPVTDLIDFTPPDAIVQNDILDLLPLKTWSEDRVCLIGDAAHATTPNLGQGGCQAIEDAWFLPLFLTKYRDPEEAFSRFHQFRKARINRIVRTSWQLGKLAHFSFAPELRNLVLRLTPKSVRQRQVNWLYTLPKFPA
jgi:2-polyprenyl-6-methoxyphenol hydroxylase-like FAD-dependent oxidoreductase